MDNVTAEWLSFARTDLGVAQHLWETYHPRPLEIICYHCQQAAEKAIKAVIICTGVREVMPRVHDLSFLLDQLTEIMEIDEQLLDFADELTSYGVSIRYPSGLVVEERHAREAMVHAAALLDWAEKACGE